MLLTRTKTGWKPIKCLDLRQIGREPGHCQRCGRNDLRYLHTVESPKGKRLEVGSECARRLCWGYSPEREEAKLRNRYVRRSRWLTRNWGLSWRGNQYLKFTRADTAVRVIVFRNDGAWTYLIVLREDDKHYAGCNFPTSAEAKLASFDHLAELLHW